MAVRGPRGRLRHRRGRGALTSRDVPPPDLRAARGLPARSPSAPRAHILLSMAALCAGGRRPAREIATREPKGSEWSISRPARALPPPTGTAATHPAGLARPPVGRLVLPGPAATHRRRSHLHPSRPRTHPIGQQWGFDSIRNSLPACRRRVGALMLPFPPLHVTWATGRDRHHALSGKPHDGNRFSHVTTPWRPCPDRLSLRG